MAYTISHSSDPGLVMLTCSKAFTPFPSLHWIRIDQRQPNSTLLYISNPSKTVWWNSSQKELLKPNSIAARYLSCGDNVGVPRDAPQEPLKATKAAAAWAKNTSTGKRVKATFSSKCESPATVVVEPAGPLLQPLEEHPGHPHQGKDEGAKGSCAKVEDCDAVNRSRQRLTQSSLVPGPEPLGEHGGQNEVGDCRGEAKAPVEPK